MAKQADGRKSLAIDKYLGHMTNMSQGRSLPPFGERHVSLDRRSTVSPQPMVGGGLFRRFVRVIRQSLAEASLVPSVGSVGDSYDNALVETINGLYKAEVIWRQRCWPSASAVEKAILQWVDWYNYQRLFGPIGYIPPAETEANYYAAIENLDRAA